MFYRFGNGPSLVVRPIAISSAPLNMQNVWFWSSQPEELAPDYRIGYDEATVGN